MRQELARALRQRIEMGSAPFFLEGMDRAGALDCAARAMTVQATAGPSRETQASLLDAPVSPPLRAATPSASASPSLRHATPTASARSAGAGADSAAPQADRAGPPADTSGMDVDTLRDAVLTCTRCRLAGTRTQAVFSDGNPDARVMVVGEAPGANEDRTGLPFVGAAGKLLDLMLASVDLSRRESVYICNVLKCRPPGNRNPQQDEIDTCSPYLRRQIELVKPEVLLAVGTFAAQLLSGRRDAALGSLRGTVHRYEGVPLVVTYHPAALLRNRGWSRPTWDDLQLLRSVLEGA